MSRLSKNAVLVRYSYFCYYGARKFLRNKRNFLQENFKKVPKQEKKRFAVMSAFNFAVEFGFVIALPLIGFGYLGKWLDAKNHTNYWVLIGILFAIIFSTVWISRRLKGIIESLR